MNADDITRFAMQTSSNEHDYGYQNLVGFIQHFHSLQCALSVSTDGQLFESCLLRRSELLIRDRRPLRAVRALQLTEILLLQFLHRDYATPYPEYHLHQ